MDASASDATGILSRFEQIFYHLRFELLFTVFAIVFWSGAQSLKRYVDSQKKEKSADFDVAPAPTKAAAKTRATAKQKPPSAAVPASLRQRGSPDEIIRAYASADKDELRSLPEEALQDYFSGLFLALVRAGQVSKLRTHVAEAVSLGMSPSPQQMESLAKMCTAKRHFSEALAAFDAAGVHASTPDAATASSWSCLLFCAVESEQFDRCEQFYKALCGLRDPLCEDFMNMIRFVVHTGDQNRLDSLLIEVQKSSSPPDNIAYNRALSVCVAAGQLGMAEKLLADMQRHEDVCDVITYNTIIKGYVESGKNERCFTLFQSMKDHGITPSEVTYGILLDSCMGPDHLDRAAQIFKEFQNSGCKLNAVLYTTLLKGLSQAGRLDQAMHVFEQMCDSEVPPDLVSYSVLIKVHCDAGKLEIALGLLDRLVKGGLSPDEIVFNNLLLGCAERKSSALGLRILGDMQRHGVQPSHVTLSIMVKLFVKCKEWDQAINLLNTSAVKYGLSSEERLYLQLAQACVRERQGKRVLQACEAWIKHCKVDEAGTGRILQQCVSFNMLDTGAELLELFLTLGGRVSPRDANALLSAALKKKRAPVMNSVVGAMQRARIPIDSQLQGQALSYQ